MLEIKQTDRFTKWLSKLKDGQGKAIITRRISRLKLGNFGDYKPLQNTGENQIFELRIDFGPGYRIYFTKQGEEIVILLVGGDKSAQSRDIKKAINTAKELK